MATNTTTLGLASAVGAPQLSIQLSTLEAAPDPTPWGPVAAVLLCLLPIFFLLATTLVRPILLRSATSLPLSAALLAFIRLAYLSSPPLLVLAHSVVGALEGLVPLAVIFGAVLLFEAMAATGCLQFLMANVRCLSAGSPIAEVFLIGWAFAYTISGVGGFSTPMALATPMLVSLGHDPLLSLVTVVGLNGLAAHLGSVGMAVWFGFKSLNLSRAAILSIGVKSAAVVGACSFVIAPAAASFLVPWKDLLCNAVFVLLSIASAVVPTVLFALFSPEFPLVAGGLVSMLVTWLLVKYGIGLKPPCTHDTPADIETAVVSPQTPTAAAAAAASKEADQPVLKPAVAAEGQGLPLQGSAALAPIIVAAHSDVSPTTNSCSTNRRSSTSSSNGGRVSPAAGVPRSPLTSPGEGATSSSSSRPQGDQLVSPFETYSKLPLPDSWLPPAASGALAAAPTAAEEDEVDTFQEAGNTAGCAHTSNSNECVAHSEVIARRSRSLVAAVAAVGGLAVQPQPATPGRPVERPACIFRCPSCAADRQELLAAEAVVDLHRQFSAPPAALRAAAAAAVQKKVDRQQQPQQQQQQQRRSSLLPALSVVNHSTGEHIVISGRDKLNGVLRLLLHPGSAFAARMPFMLGPSSSNPDLAALAPAWSSPPRRPVNMLEVLTRTLPIWLTVLLLLVTHVPAFKLQDLLRSTYPSFTLHLGTLGSFSLSPALVVQLRRVFTWLSANWTAELLYMPCLIPFVVVSCVTLALFRRDLQEAGTSWREPFVLAWSKVKGTVSTMLGALVLSQLMCAGGSSSPAFIIAYYLTSWMGKGYLAIAGFLGALGSFVSGSVMGSNMTQGGIQAVAAARLGVPVTSLLAVQVAGACAGKMVCISSILSAKVVMSELHDVSEAEVIRRTAPLALLFVILAQMLGLIWTLGGVWPDAS